MVTRPKPDLAQAQAPGRVEHQHRPRGAEGDVEDEDASAPGCAPPRGGAPSGSPRRCPARTRVRRGSGRARRARQHDPGDEHRARARPGRPAPRTATPCPRANSAAPIGGPASWLTVMNPVCSRELRDRQVVAVRRASAGASGERCRRRSPRCPAANSATSTTGDRDAAGDDRRRPARPARRRARRSTAITMRRRSSRSVSAPAHSPNSSGGATAQWPPARPGTARRVSEATSSGPAASAIPSPRLEIQDEARSNRNRGPRRLGTTTSTTRLTRSRR